MSSEAAINDQGDRAVIEPHFVDDLVTLHHGDCLTVLASLPSDSVDAVVTDPPYGLEFMGQDWDRPWAVSPTQSVGFEGREANLTHRDGRNANCRACGGRQRGIKRCSCEHPDWDRSPTEDMRAFQVWCEAWAMECRRVLKPGGHLLAFGGTRTWHRLACAIEDAGFELRDSIAWLYGSGFPKSLNLVDEVGDRTGWGTALKPAHEPIVVARRPLAGTVASNVAEHGTGALHIDACRTATEDTLTGSGAPPLKHGGLNPRPFHDDAEPRGVNQHDAGRWPTNVLLSHDQAEDLDRQTGVLTSGANPTRRGSDKFRDAYGVFAGQEECTPARGADSGGASRFFPTFRYEAKAGADERPRDGDVAHPTVKPLDLMRWLVRLVTPPGGTVLEPFAGSGTTAEACVIEGFRCIAIEKHAPYLPLIVQRLTKPVQPVLFGGGA